MMRIAVLLPLFFLLAQVSGRSLRDAQGSLEPGPAPVEQDPALTEKTVEALEVQLEQDDADDDPGTADPEDSKKPAKKANMKRHEEGVKRAEKVKPADLPGEIKVMMFSWNTEYYEPPADNWSTIFTSAKADVEQADIVIVALQEVKAGYLGGFTVQKGGCHKSSSNSKLADQNCLKPMFKDGKAVITSLNAHKGADKLDFELMDYKEMYGNFGTKVKKGRLVASALASVVTFGSIHMSAAFRQWEGNINSQVMLAFVRKGSGLSLTVEKFRTSATEKGSLYAIVRSAGAESKPLAMIASSHLPATKMKLDTSVVPPNEPSDEFPTATDEDFKSRNKVIRKTLLDAIETATGTAQEEKCTNEALKTEMATAFPRGVHWIGDLNGRMTMSPKKCKDLAGEDADTAAATLKKVLDPVDRERRDTNLFAQSLYIQLGFKTTLPYALPPTYKYDKKSSAVDVGGLFEDLHKNPPAARDSSAMLKQLVKVVEMEGENKCVPNFGWLDRYMFTKGRAEAEYVIVLPGSDHMPTGQLGVLTNVDAAEHKAATRQHYFAEGVTTTIAPTPAP